VSYSIADLLHLLRAEGGERLRIDVGLAPVFVIKREDYEVEGPIIREEAADFLFRSVTDSQHVNELLERGFTEFVHELESSRFLVCAMKEHGNVRLEFTLVTG
jgi:hypothetical protein